MESRTELPSETLAGFLAAVWRFSRSNNMNAGDLLLLADGKAAVMTELVRCDGSVARLEVRRLVGSSREPDSRDLMSVKFYPGDAGKSFLVGHDVLGSGVPAEMFRVEGKLEVRPDHRLGGRLPGIDVYQVIAQPYVQRKRIATTLEPIMATDPLLVQLVGGGEAIRLDGRPTMAEEINRLLALAVSSMVRMLSREPEFAEYIRRRIESPNVPQPMSKKLAKSAEWAVFLKSIELLGLAFSKYLRFLDECYGNEEGGRRQYLLALTEYMIRVIGGGVLSGVDSSGWVKEYSDRRDGLKSWIGDFLADEKLAIGK